MADEIESPITSVPRMGNRRAVYVPNHRSFGAFMRSDQMRDVTEEAAKDIAELAAAKTPDSKEGAAEHTGLHAKVKAGFKTKRNAGLMKVGGNLRVKVEVVNDVDGAALVEFGARGVPRSRMLGQAGATVGDFKPEGGPT